MRKRIHNYQLRQHMLSSNYEIFHYSNTDIESIHLHHHDFYEFYLFLSGDVTYQIEGTTYYLKPHDMVLINSKELHQAVIENRNTPYERIVLWINMEFLKSLSSATTDLTECFENPEKKNVLRTSIEIHQNVKTILEKLLSLEKYDGIGKDLLYKAYIVEMMVILNSVSLNSKMSIVTEVKKSNLIDRIIDYINSHIDEEITIDDLSDQFFLSKFHLSREFKKQTGTTIHRYIVQKKLIQSKEFILRGMPITDVFKQCGFGDYSNFFRAFKSEYGVTPKQFYQLNNGSHMTYNLLEE